MPMKGYLMSVFPNHVTITTPNGVTFQVARDDLMRTDHGLELRPETKIEHIFPNRNNEAEGWRVSIPDGVIEQLPTQ